MNKEKAKLIHSLFVPSILLVLMWLLMLYQWYFSKSLYFLGVQPLHFNGLQGIITSIFIHGSWSHLLSNSAPFFLFTAALYYYYPKIANKVFIGLWITSGLYLWLFARGNWHIGASGLVYSLAFFHIMSALIQRELKLVSFSMLIIFLYGSMIWGFFPEFFPQENISWQGHLTGAVVGIIFAIFFSHHAPKAKKYFEDEDDEEDDDLLEEENSYWKASDHTAKK
jgi:membrane associated rhomboid family serine protease